MIAPGVLAFFSSVLALSSSDACTSRLTSTLSDHPVAPRWTNVGIPQSQADLLPAVPSQKVIFDTHEGTLMNVDVAPDGAALTFDLLGDIYLLPSEGGVATPLTTGRPWDQAPRFSLNGDHIYFVSDRVGVKNIWQLTLADRSLRQITRSESDILGAPNWSQHDERLLVGVGDVHTRNTEVFLHSIDPVTGAMMPINEPGAPWIDMNTFVSKRPAVKVFSAVETADGEVFYSQARFDEKLNRPSVRLYKFNRKVQSGTVITPPGADYNEYKPQLSHGGNLLAYFRQYPNRRTEIRILNLKSGHDDALVELRNADDASYSPAEDSRPNYAFSPDDQDLILWHGGKIHRVSLADGSSEIIPFRVRVELEVWARALPPAQSAICTSVANVIRWPNIASDGSKMTLSAFGYVWLLDLRTGSLRRLTTSSDLEYMPVLSPDGTSVAYISFPRLGDIYGAGRLMVVQFGEEPREVLSAQDTTFLLPNWSSDGKKLAAIQEMTAGDGDLEAYFGWTHVGSGRFHRVASAPASDDRSSFRVYSRFVGFDKTGAHLLFSYLRSSKEAVLVMANLDGGGRQKVAVGTPDVGGIVPSPDLRSLILIRRNGTVWLVPFKAGSKPISVGTSASDALRVSKGAGYYATWNEPGEFLSYGLGNSVYRFSLDRRQLEVMPIRVAFDQAEAAQPIAFEGARLITMSDNNSHGVIELGTILLRGNRIAALGPIDDIAIPSNAIIIDASGTTIMPGLLDSHYHRIGGSGLSALAVPNGHFNDWSANAYGITTAWEPGGAVNDGVPAIVDLQRAGRIAGPRWSHSGMGAVGYPFEMLTSPGAALFAVKQHRELGVAVLKEYNTPTREQRQWLVAAAHEYGLGIVSHIESFDGMMTRIVDGFTGGDHPYVPVPFFKDVLELLRQTGYIWTPNIIISNGSVGGYTDVQRYYWRHVLLHRPGEREKLKRLSVDNRAVHELSENAKVPYNIHRASRVAKQAASASKSGAHIGVSAHNMPAVNLHGELWLLWMGGLPAEDVLRAATIGNAEKLGLQREVGSLERGKIADLLVLEDNPLEDIINTLSLKYTVRNGIVYDAKTARKADLSNSANRRNPTVLQRNATLRCKQRTECGRQKQLLVRDGA